MTAIGNATARPGEATTTAFKSRFLARMVIVLIGGMFLDGYVLGILGPVSGRMAEDLQLTAVSQGLIAAAALVGILFGAPLGAGPPTSGAGSQFSCSTSVCSPSRRACSFSLTHQCGSS